MGGGYALLPAVRHWQAALGQAASAACPLLCGMGKRRASRAKGMARPLPDTAWTAPLPCTLSHGIESNSRSPTLACACGLPRAPGACPWWLRHGGHCGLEPCRRAWELEAHGRHGACAVQGTGRLLACAAQGTGRLLARGGTPGVRSSQQAQGSKLQAPPPSHVTTSRASFRTGPAYGLTRPGPPAAAHPSRVSFTQAGSAHALGNRTEARPAGTLCSQIRSYIWPERT